jgi:hypothetical protein
MLCPKCSNENREESKYCRHCGADLARSGGRGFWFNFILSPKFILSVILFGLLAVGTAYAAPKLSDYIRVSNDIKTADALGSQGKYKESLDILNGTDPRWKFARQNDEIKKLIDKYGRFLSFRESFARALEYFAKGDTENAKAGLNSIQSDYPEFKKVQTKLAEVQTKIEDDLKLSLEEKEKKIQETATAEEEAKKQAELAASAEAAARQRERDAAAKADAVKADREKAQALADAAAELQSRAAASKAAAEQAAKDSPEQPNAFDPKAVDTYINKWRSTGDFINLGHDQMSAGWSAEIAHDPKSAMDYYHKALEYYNLANTALGDSYIPEMKTSHKYLKLAIESFISWETNSYNALFYSDDSYKALADSALEQGNSYIKQADANVGKF